MIKLWIDDRRPAPEGYVWRKSVIILFLLCCLCFSFIGCTKQPETIIEYIEIPTEVVIEKIVEVEVPVEKEVIKEVEVIVEKEIIKEIEVPVEVIVEKEIIKTVYIEKEVALSECSVITWEEVLNLKTGDRLENVFIMGNSFVSKFTNELYPAGYQTYWTSNAKKPEAFSMKNVCGLKINYGKKVDWLLTDYYTWGNIGIVSGTIENIIWHIDEYGNKSVEIVFAKKDFELKTFIDFCPISE